MSVVVDTNAGEDEVYRRLAAKLGEDTVSRRRLDVGDVLLEDAERGLIIVERKSWADLQSSLADGRMREQKARQMAAIAERPGARIVWLVHGQLLGWHSVVPPQNMPAGWAEAALINAAVGDGIHVIRARDEEGATEAIAHLHAKLKAGRLDGAANAQERVASGYAGVCKVKKGANTDDPSTQWRLMLASLRGVSAARAAAVAARFPAPAALTDALREAGSHKSGVKMIADISLGDGKGRLGPALAKRIAGVFAA